jgi:hypothetical protein
VRVSATYAGHEDWQPGIAHETVAVIAPSTGATPRLITRFPEPHQPGGVRGDGFRVSGSYLDRSMENEYPIITSWPEDDEKG